MQLPPDTLLQHRLQRWSKYLIASMILISLLVLMGWQFNIVYLKAPISPQAAMNPVSAMGFILSGISLWLFAKKSYVKIAYLLAAVVLVIGLLKFGYLAFGFDFHIDTFLFTDQLLDAKTATMANRMAPNTAFCFVLAGVSLL